MIMTVREATEKRLLNGQTSSAKRVHEEEDFSGKMYAVYVKSILDLLDQVCTRHS